jgi:hypothetical protein
MCGFNTQIFLLWKMHYVYKFLCLMTINAKHKFHLFPGGFLDLNPVNFQP